MKKGRPCLDVQRKLVRVSIKGVEPIAEFCEEYTGTVISKCVKLREAINFAKEKNAILVIPKAGFFKTEIEALFTIIDEIGEENIIFWDSPDGSNRFNLTVVFLGYIQQSKLAQINTKFALDQIKNEIKKDGSHISNNGNEITHLGRKLGTKLSAGCKRPSEYLTTSFRDKIGADTNRRRQWLLVQQLRSKGDTMEVIAATMNALEELTPRGCKWSSGTISAVLDKWGDYFLEEDQVNINKKEIK